MDFKTEDKDLLCKEYASCRTKNESVAFSKNDLKPERDKHKKSVKTEFNDNEEDMTKRPVIRLRNMRELLSPSKRNNSSRYGNFEEVRESLNLHKLTIADKGS